MGVGGGGFERIAGQSGGHFEPGRVNEGASDVVSRGGGGHESGCVRVADEINADFDSLYKLGKQIR